MVNMDKTRPVVVHFLWLTREDSQVRKFHSEYAATDWANGMIQIYGRGIAGTAYDRGRFLWTF